MKKIFRAIAILLTVSLATCGFSGCDKQPATPSFTKETVYSLYWDTVQALAPEWITEPRSCDVDLKTRDEVTYGQDHFVRDLKTKIQAQTVNGKWEYSLHREFSDADNHSFFCIRNNRCFYGNYYSIGTKIDLKEYTENQDVEKWSTLLCYVPMPIFGQDAIKSFVTEPNDTGTKISFIVDGTRMEPNYPLRVMIEITQTLALYAKDSLDDVEMTLTVGQDGKPTAMTAKQSMTIFDNDGKMRAQKTLETEYVFNEWDTVSFDLDEIAAQYTTGIPE